MAATPSKVEIYRAIAARARGEKAASMAESPASTPARAAPATEGAAGLEARISQLEAELAVAKGRADAAVGAERAAVAASRAELEAALSGFEAETAKLQAATKAREAAKAEAAKATAELRFERQRNADLTAALTAAESSGGTSAAALEAARREADAARREAATARADAARSAALLLESEAALAAAEEALAAQASAEVDGRGEAADGVIDIRLTPRCAPSAPRTAAGADDGVAVPRALRAEDGAASRDASGAEGGDESLPFAERIAELAIEGAKGDSVMINPVMGIAAAMDYSSAMYDFVNEWREAFDEAFGREAPPASRAEGEAQAGPGDRGGGDRGGGKAGTRERYEELDRQRAAAALEMGREIGEKVLTAASAQLHAGASVVGAQVASRLEGVTAATVLEGVSTLSSQVVASAVALAQPAPGGADAPGERVSPEPLPPPVFAASAGETTGEAV